MGSLAEGGPQIPMSFQTQGTHATLPDTGIGPDDDVVSLVSRHEIYDTHAHRAKSVAAGVPVEAHEKLVLEVKGPQEALGKSQCMLDAMQSRLQAMEQAQNRSEAQLDLLNRLQQSGAVPMSSAQAPPSSHGKDPGAALVSLRRILDVCAICAEGLSCTQVPSWP
uniref:Uncharacterized protein n=1 Tax=Peronospora matthiolae TaxID=2874970 RepID=A0AAV1UXM2_9STRA